MSRAAGSSQAAAPAGAELERERPARREGAARRRPRLLIITPDFPPAHGGIQVIAHRLAAGLSGFEREVVALDGPGARAFDANNALVVRRVRAAGSRPALHNAQLNALGALHALRFRPQATLCLHPVASPATLAIRAALGAPAVQYFHANEIVGRPRLAAFAARRADVVIAVSSYTAGLIAATGAAPAALRIIPPGVDLPPARRSPPCERPTFVTISRLRDSYKGHDVLVRALELVRARVPDVQWLVLGDGPLRTGLEALAREHGVEGSVRFLGAVSDEQRDEWLARADLLAMPSRLPDAGLAGEGFGIVYMEAAASGKPVVAGDVGGALDAVLDGQTGLLVDPTDALAVAEAITRLLLDRELAGRLGRAGQLRAQEFAWPKIVERVEGVLLEALESRIGA
ncbi:MAG TPA: glycosyltransferase family 4 protein [Solirubrobacteraceae bacterium]|nr:glycosyltransferase family 4 protein [Solirubrobacteraceae bacterium]